MPLRTFRKYKKKKEKNNYFKKKRTSTTKANTNKTLQNPQTNK